MNENKLDRLSSFPDITPGNQWSMTSIGNQWVSDA